MGATKKSRAEYWKDWYWNRGGREKVMAKRYINEYERTRKQKRMKSIKEKAEEYSFIEQGIGPSGIQYRDFSINKKDAFMAGANYVLEQIEKCLQGDLSSHSTFKLKCIKQIIKELKQQSV